MERRYSPSTDVHLCRDASPSNICSQCNCNRPSSSSSSSSSSIRGCSHMNEEWAHKPRQQHDVEKHMKRQRWSTYTADTSSTALESGNEDSSMLFSRHGRKISCDDSTTLLDVNEGDDEETIPGTLISAEDQLNAALVSMLSTANDLLISTMTARSDLARLQMMESALDEQLDRREEAILMEINNNEKMTKWMEKASEKLDRVLFESSNSTKPTNTAAMWSRSGASDINSRHWRATSTTGQVSSLETLSSLGVSEAKNEISMTSKSAAKRLENVLNRANSSSNGITAAQSRMDSSHTKDRLGPAITAREKSTDLASRFGMPSSSTLAPTPSPLLVPIDYNTPAPSPSFSERSDFRIRTPSITSESGPSSVVSSREDNSISTLQVLLTPQTPYEELPYLTTSPLEDDSKHGFNKRSTSSLRSPNPITGSRHMSSGGNVSEATLNRLTWQQEDASDSSSKSSSQMLGSKGALEALRKLNGGSSFGQTVIPSPSPGWGGALASWVGMSSPNQ